MKKHLKLLASLLLFAGIKVSGQGTVLPRYQDSLQNLMVQVNQAENDDLKIITNAEFVKTLVNALKIPFSYNFPFDSLKNVSIVKAPDNRFRMISWYIPMKDGSYRFYGTIQMSSTDGKLKLFPLSDRTEVITDPNEVGSNKNWYGARYYDIIPVQITGKQPYYVLLGWKGKSGKTSSKVIEVLSFEKEMPLFGKAIFDGVKTPKPQNRIIFEYNKLNTMTLQRDPAVNLIVFEHLAPMDPSKKGDFEFYAGDSSFDAYKISNGRLKLVENVPLNNPPSSQDEFYNNPKKLVKIP